jgi:hypothetical protein
MVDFSRLESKTKTKKEAEELLSDISQKEKEYNNLESEISSLGDEISFTNDVEGLLDTLKTKRAALDNLKSIIDNLKTESLNNNFIDSSSIFSDQPEGYFIRDNKVFLSTPSKDNKDADTLVLDGVIVDFSLYDTPLSRLVDECVYKLSIKNNFAIDDFKGDEELISSRVGRSVWDNGRAGNFGTQLYIKRFILFRRASRSFKVISMPDEPGFFIDDYDNDNPSSEELNRGVIISNYNIDKPSSEELNRGIECYYNLRKLYKTPSSMDIQLKWFLLAPFSFIFKQLPGEYFFPSLLKFGVPDSLKSTSTQDLYNLYYSCDMFFSHNKHSGVSLESPAKLDEVFIRNTFPTLISEIEQFISTPLGNKLMYGILKDSSMILRHNKDTSGTGRIVKTFLTLSGVIMDGNDNVNLDKSQLKRMLKIDYSVGDSLSSNELKAHFDGKKLLNLVELRFLFNDFYHYMVKNHNLNDYDNWISIIDSYFSSIGLKVDPGEPGDIDIESRNQTILLEAEEQSRLALVGFDDKHLDIYEALCRISFLPKYVGIRPEDGESKFSNWTSYNMKLKVGLDNDQFHTFLTMGNELRILNIKNFPDELVEWKKLGFLNLRTIYDVCKRNGVKCSYVNKSFRGRTHKLLSINNIDDIDPEFQELLRRRG